MEKPNLFIVGSAKCGTTTLYAYLKKSEDVFFPVQKEPNFFLIKNGLKKFNGPNDQLFFKYNPKTLVEYQKLYQDAGNRKVVVDASTLYLNSSEAAREIFNYNRNAKIIIILRNPVNRAYSHYLHHQREGTETKGTFEEAIQEELNGKRDDWAPLRRHFYMGDYLQQLSVYYEVFPTANIKVYKFEDFIKAPNTYLSDVSKFLNIEDIFEDFDIKKHNASGLPKYRKLHSFYMGTLKTIRKLFPFLTHSKLSIIRRYVDNIYRNRFLEKPSLDKRLLYKLKELYKKNYLEIERLTGLNLDDWR